MSRESIMVDRVHVLSLRKALKLRSQEQEPTGKLKNNLKTALMFGQ